MKFWLFLLFFSHLSWADDLLGFWVVPGGDAVVEISQDSQGLVNMTLAALLQPELKDLNNPQPNKRQRSLLGVKLGQGFSREANNLSSGKLYDPDSGKFYKASAKLLVNGDLQIRGYIGLPAFGQSQTWRRYDSYKRSILAMFAELQHE